VAFRGPARHVGAPAYLSDRGRQRLSSIVTNAVSTMHEELTAKGGELQKALREPTSTNDPEWFIRESISVESSILDSLRAALETWALDENARARARQRRQSITMTVRKMIEERADRLAERRKPPRKDQ
jgi:hypothetical protein